MSVDRDVVFDYDQLDLFPHPLRADRRAWPYGKSNVSYGDTEAMLLKELDMMGASTAVLQVAVGFDGWRRDGLLKANARAEHPGVVLNVTTPQGALTFATDLFRHWQDNVRAIAFALEGLRRVERYGINRGGEQYRGYKALPAGGSETDESTIVEMTAGQAREVICESAGSLDLAPMWATLPPEVRNTLIKTALKNTHPDNGGDPETFARVQQAKEKLA